MKNYGSLDVDSNVSYHIIRKGAIMMCFYCSTHVRMKKFVKTIDVNTST